MRELFRHVAHRTSDIVATPGAFLSASVLILIWLVSGPLFDFSDTWQLIINTGTTIITFLMVFLIQNSQTRDTKSIQLKLDELLRSIKAARNEMVNLEDLSDEELERLRQEFTKLGNASRTGHT
jgi:low affinity Fe/Cu permease